MQPEPHHWMSYLGGLVSPFIAAMAKLVAEANDVYLHIDKLIADLERAIGPYLRFNKALI